jgi:hypothetical protein
MSKRTDTEILKDLVEAVREYNSLRDDEWDFEEENGDRDFWDGGTNDTHEKLLNTIMESRSKIRNLIIEATGDETITF